MADTESKWRQHMDKIAYGVAVLLGLVVIAIPALSGRSDNNELAEQERALDERMEKQVILGVTPPVLRPTLEKQWDAGSASGLDPKWVTEIPPVLVRTLGKIDKGVAVHDPGSITEISVQRDQGKKAVYLDVKYAAGAGNSFVVIKKWELLRKADEGDFQPAPGFKHSEEHEFKDYQVESGKKYTYKLVTVAQLDPKAADTQFAEKIVRQESAPLGPTETVPFDFSVVVVNFPKPTENEPVKFLGKLTYWSYKEMKIKEVNGGQIETFPEKGTFADKRYQFLSIVEPKVVVKDLEKNVKYTFSLDSKTHRPVKLWEPLAAAAPATAETDQPPEGAPKGGKSSPAKKASASPPEEGGDQAEAPQEPEKPAPAPTKKTSTDTGKKKRAFK